MGLFDFLKPQLRATPGAQSAAPDGQTMQMPPVLQQQGFGDRLKQAYAGGPSFQDRALMALLALQGQTGAAMQMRQGFKKQSQDDDERRRRNEALKGAYKDGRFDRDAYMAAMGDQGDAMEAIEIEAAMGRMKPESRIQVTPRGVYRIGEDDYEQLEEFEQEPPNAPAGFRWKEDGSGLELIPGYAEGVGQVTGVRREAVTSRPMPRQGGGGRGGGGARPRSYGQDEVQW